MSLLEWGSLAEIGTFILMVYLALSERSQKMPGKWRSLLISIVAVIGIVSASLIFYSTRQIETASKTSIQWEQLPIIPVDGKIYSRERVVVDGISFRNCKFQQVTLIYNGTGPFEMIKCSIEGPANLGSDKPEIRILLYALYSLQLFKADVQYIPEK